jgi:hypothetical protein
VVATEIVGDWALARFSWSGAVTSTLGNEATSVRQSSLAAQLRSPEWRGFRLEATTQRDVGSRPCGASARMQRHSAALSFGGQQSGVSLHYLTRIERETGGVPRDTLTVRSVGPTTRGYSLTAWRMLGRAVVAASLGSRSRWREQRETIFTPGGGVDTIPSDSGPVIIPNGPRYETRINRGLLHGFGTELRLAWAGGRMAFDALAGHALGARSPAGARTWAQSGASFAVTPSVALVGGLVLDDGWETRQPSPRRYFTLGARLTSSAFSRPVEDRAGATRAVATAFRLQASGDGNVTLGIRSATARLVELTGDFLQWRAVRMQRVSADWWELRMPMPSGVHRVNVRVDGGKWNAPPGLPRQQDEFGGDAGVFVVP